MALKPVYDKIDDIDEPYRGLFTERDGKHHFTGVEGLPTPEDVARLTASLGKERTDHKTTKEKYKPWDTVGKTHEEIQALLDKLPELEAAAEGKLDETKINGLVEGRLRAKIAPVERDLISTRNENLALKTENEGLKAANIRREIKDAVLVDIRELKVIAEAEEDVLLYADRLFEKDEAGKIVTKDGVGVTPGLSPKAWLTDQQAKRPHWWPRSGGTGGNGDGNGGGGFKGTVNPFSHEGWNLTAQGNLLRTDATKAESMAKAAGTTIGGPRPAPKK